MEGEERGENEGVREIGREREKEKVYGERERRGYRGEKYGGGGGTEGGKRGKGRKNGGKRKVGRG